MSLFPQSFLEDLKTQTNIVSVIGEVVSLRKTGGTYKGLCPFHQEKTPSFNVNPDKGFFKCFGCGAGGDVLKFVELHQKLPFPEAVRYLAARAGIQVPEAEGGPEDRAAAAVREALLKVHETAAAFYREQLASAAGARARRELEQRGLRPETIETFGYGYAPAAGRDSLHAHLANQKVPDEVLIKSGLVVQRDDGRLVDRFRNRLMIPIARDTGAIVAFGGRALEQGQVPKYLNSPETPIYSKGRTLYGLDVTKGAVRKHNYCVLVEGYFDLAQVWQSGVQPVVASCGTALTAAQARTLKRFTTKVVLSFDPDTAGQTAAARSSELLVSEGFQVNVALLPEGSDPDAFIRRQGGQAYVERLKGSRPYLEYLLDRAADRLDVSRMDSRKRFLDQMLSVAANIPDAAVRDQFADRLAHKARITEGVVREEIKKAAAQRRTEAPAVAVPARVNIRPAEQGLLWTLAHRPVEGLAAVAQLEPEDLEGLVTAPVFRLAASLSDVPPEVLPELLGERLSEGEAALLERAAASETPAASPGDCVNALRRLRFDRERSALQDEIDQVQAARPADADRQLETLWQRKKALLTRIEELSS
ncbi:MAG TPA: DNA primase [Vicinamibacterales bacterium]|nr:DNA primase [Vicinamibacterales bacterium]